MSKNSYTQANNPTLPHREYPLTDATGTVQTPWHRFFTALLSKTGGSANAVAQTGYLTTDGSGVTAFQAGTDKSLGTILLSGSPGGVAEEVPASTSPANFLAQISGTFLASSGTIQITRNGIAFPAGAAGGAIALRSGDQVNVSWTGGAPTLTWLPN